MDLDRLQNALSGRFFHLQLRDRTVPPRDLWEGAGEDSLEGRYFQILQQAAQNATGRRPRPCAWRLASAAGFWRGRR